MAHRRSHPFRHAKSQLTHQLSRLVYCPLPRPPALREEAIDGCQLLVKLLWQSLINQPNGLSAFGYLDEVS